MLDSKMSSETPANQYSRPQRRKQASIESFFGSTKKQKVSNENNPNRAMLSPRIPMKPIKLPRQAYELGSRLRTKPILLTDDGKSWFIHVKDWYPPQSSKAFDTEWNLHPETYHKINLYGKTFLEKRWSQAWGFSYRYSGSLAKPRPIQESTIIQDLIQRCNALTVDTNLTSENGSSLFSTAYNGCLQNWYLPEHSIGLHADDESDLIAGMPIFSLSWGGTRRFLFRPKPSASSSKGEKAELWLEDGDLLVMGGTCQQTHKHEVPNLRKTMDPPTSNRINWTIRAFQA